MGGNRTRVTELEGLGCRPADTTAYALPAGLEPAISSLTTRRALLAALRKHGHALRKRWESNPHALSGSLFSKQVPPPVGWLFLGLMRERCAGLDSNQQCFFVTDLQSASFSHLDTDALCRREGGSSRRHCCPLLSSPPLPSLGVGRERCSTAV